MAPPQLPDAVADQLGEWRSRDKSLARTTTALLDLIESYAGADPSPAVLRRGFGRFPVVGYVWYQDDYGAPRFRFAYRFHEGTDLFAIKGTPVIAVVDGVIWKLATSGGGGNAIWLLGDDGVRYYYGHLQGFAPGIEVGLRVRRGEPIARVGDSGNAKGTYPHVHFEVNPGGLGTINPKPVLDAWLADAEAAARAALAATPPSDPVGNARWDLLAEEMTSTARSAPAPLWSAGLNETGALVAHLDLVMSDLFPIMRWRDDALFEGAGPGRLRAWEPLDPLLILDPPGPEH